MKKRLLCFLLIIFVTTGCTCEYNLNIEDYTFTESVTIRAENNTEVNNINREYKIPVDKDDYNKTNYITDTNIYNVEKNNSNITFSNVFNFSSIMSSSAISNCFNKVIVTSVTDGMALSTSPEAICYSKNPNLSSLVINITVDREVLNNNADRVSGNKYTWIIDKNNASNKSINLTIKNKDNSNIDSKEDNKNNIDNYGIYIFSIILLGLIYAGYKVYKNVKENDKKNNQI